MKKEKKCANKNPKNCKKKLKNEKNVKDSIETFEKLKILNSWKSKTNDIVKILETFKINIVLNFNKVQKLGVENFWKFQQFWIWKKLNFKKYDRKIGITKFLRIYCNTNLVFLNYHGIQQT